MSTAEQMQELIEDLAELFHQADSMEQLDAADFKDKAYDIWSLVERAREIMKGSE